MRRKTNIDVMVLLSYINYLSTKFFLMNISIIIEIKQNDIIDIASYISGYVMILWL